jgi:hypothetical protein
MFSGVVEIYNLSSRATAVCSYQFWARRPDGEWQPIESERYEETDTTTGQTIIYNDTPITLAPYSGAGLFVRAFTTATQLHQMTIRIELEDLFGRHHRLEVTVNPTAH